MRLFKLKNPMRTTKRQLIRFLGYNATAVAKDGELCDMRNMSSDEFPCLAPRGAREEIYTLEKPNGLGAGSALYYVDGEHFFYEKGERTSNTALAQNFSVVSGKLTCSTFITGSFKGFKDYYIRLSGFVNNPSYNGIFKATYAFTTVLILEDEGGIFDTYVPEDNATVLSFERTEARGVVTDTPKKFTQLKDQILIFPDKKMYNTTTGEFSDLENVFVSDPTAVTTYFTTNTIVSTKAFDGFCVGDLVTISGSTQTGNNQSNIEILGISSDLLTLTFANSTFTAVSSPNQVITISRTDNAILGDVDGAGATSENDLNLLNQYLVNAVSLTDLQKAQADVTQDGLVNILDSLKMQQIILGSVGTTSIASQSYANVIACVGQTVTFSSMTAGSTDFRALGYRRGQFIRFSGFAGDNAIYNGAYRILSVDSDSGIDGVGGKAITLDVVSTYFDAFVAETATVSIEGKTYAGASFLQTSAYAWVATNTFEFTTNTIVASNPMTCFRVGDVIGVVGSAKDENNKEVQIISISDNQKTITVGDGTFTAWTETTTITLCRTCPDLTFVCQHHNRVWGVAGNTIYACAFGDPTNWRKFEDLETDSFTVDVGTAGDFTAVVSYGGYVWFFKEDVVHKLYGETPGGFQLVSLPMKGVQAGCHHSVVQIEGTLFYKARDGFASFNGGLPTIISHAFGLTPYSNVSAGTDGKKYYATLTDGTAYQLFVFDTRNRLWHIEDNEQAVQFATLDGYLYMQSAISGKIWKLNSGSETVKWYATLFPFDELQYEKKGYTKLHLRAELEAGASLQVQVKCDNAGYDTVAHITSSTKKVFIIPIKPRMCDTFTVKLSGKGNCKVLGLEREFYMTEGV